MKRISSPLVVLLAALALPVQAQTAPARDPGATPGVDKRQANQQQRIEQGVKSGELTAKEATRLEQGQERVRAMEGKAKADGKVTVKERERLQQAQNQQSQKVYREKHDRQHDRNHDGKMDRPAKRR